METPTWLRDHAEPGLRDRLPVLRYPGGNELRQTGDPEEQQRDLVASFDRLRDRHASAEYRADEAAEIMRARTSPPPASFIAEDRPRALDLLGFSSQLVFNTFHNGRLHDLEHAGDVDLAYARGPGPQPGHARVLLGRPPPAGHLLRPPGRPRAGGAGRRRGASAQGAAALLVASGCPPGHSPSHLDLVPVWARAQEAGIPVVFHVGGTGDADRSRTTSSTACPIPPDFHGGDENFRSVDYMGIPVPPAQTLATMIFDGVLERFPELRIGVIEQGAIWVPSWMRQMESAFEAFPRHEERLQALSLRPTEYVHRQVRFTPYPTEDVGWIIEQAGPELVMFSSDYPHVEGGRKPIERFEASLGRRRRRGPPAFYVDNFLFLMGTRRARRLAA